MSELMCTECGARLPEETEFCPECGNHLNVPKIIAPSVAKAQFCSQCGVKLNPTQIFCVKCGTKTDAGFAKYSIEKMRITQKRKIQIIAILCGILAFAVVVLFAVRPKKINFKDVFVKIGGDNFYCTLAGDNSYLSIDTNPNDVDDYFSEAAWSLVKRANREFGLPESVDQKMNNTRALDGRQTDIYGKIRVSWTYHPNQGLEITYEYAE